MGLTVSDDGCLVCCVLVLQQRLADKQRLYLHYLLFLCKLLQKFEVHFYEKVRRMLHFYDFRHVLRRWFVIKNLH